MRPSGTVTFLFTDVEGSTRRWEAGPDAMRSALAAHDEVLRVAIEAHGGWLFKHTGDGVCAAFGSPRGAIDAAIDAQHSLGLPVRMGVATGEAELRGDDYFGPALNRAARVMAAGHGGQILVAAATAALVSGVGLVDLGERRLRDLSGAEHLFQVAGEGLRVEFPPLRTLDATPGNLAVQSTSFVGRQVEVKELCELVRAHRLVTLTGAGGVGKTRLAVQVAAELTGEFADGVWLIELAPVGDPTAVPDVVATTLGVTAQAGLSVTASVVRALAGRRLLIVLDNCEHVLDAAADLVEAVLAGTDSVRVLATSREGLRVAAERLWPVPSLEAESAATELFADRALAVNPTFDLKATGVADAVVEICERLDGIALGIELAAARMVSMSPAEVRDRLGDRFRLLSGARRGLERHQTLRHAVGWSFDLLHDNERAVLCRCALFAGGFDLAAATQLCAEAGLDEYALLDVLDSLVRKSLITVAHVSGRSRYAMLETIRQYAQDQLAAAGEISAVGDRHAWYFADQAVVYWEICGGPDQRVALDWVDVEFANLRAGYGWAVDRGDIACAAAIAAHAAMIAFAMSRFEPVGWAEEILPAATIADLAQLPRLYTAASLCTWTGRFKGAIGYAETAVALEADARYDAFDTGWSGFWEATANAFTGRTDRYLEICAHLAGQPGLAHVVGVCSGLHIKPFVLGLASEAMAEADDALSCARALGNPFWIASALLGCGRAFMVADAGRALAALREGLDYSRQQRQTFWETIILREIAVTEAAHGEIDEALGFFDTTLDSFRRAGNLSSLAIAFTQLAVVFDRIEQPEIAATLFGASSTPFAPVVNLADARDHVRTVLGDMMFDKCVATGEAMEPADAVHYARNHIEQTRQQLGQPQR